MKILCKIPIIHIAPKEHTFSNKNTLGKTNFYIKEKKKFLTRKNK